MKKHWSTVTYHIEMTSREEPDNLSTQERTDRMTQRHLVVDYDNYERFR